VNRTGAQAALAVGALGVVFGDIGTSPLYTIQTVFNPGDPHPIAATRESVFGVVSLIFWSVTLIVTVTYVLLVMRAANMHPFAVAAVNAQDLDRLAVRGAEPVRHAGVELGDFAWSHGDVVLAEDQAHLP
jgi:KUP system potassium uptake protein